MGNMHLRVVGFCAFFKDYFIAVVVVNALFHQHYTNLYLPQITERNINIDSPKKKKKKNNN